MKHDELEIVRGSGNVFRDFGHEEADIEQFKAILAAEILRCSTAKPSVFDRRRSRQVSPPPISPASAPLIWSASPWIG